jgi:small subunit ribosomal protein S16
MLKIRLRRMGKRHRPFYRVVVSDSRSVPTAPAVEEIGHYDPMTKPPRVRVDLERVEHWAGQGAQLSPAVRKLVKGVRTGRHERAVEEAPAPKADAPKVEEPAEEATSEAAAEAAAPAAEAEAVAEPEVEAAEEKEPEAAEELEAKAEAAAEKPVAETEEEPEAEKKAAAEVDESATDQ